MVGTAPATGTSPLKQILFASDLVVVPYVDSTTRERGFWFDKVLSCNESEARLLQLVPVDPVGDDDVSTMYQANIASVWCAPTSACHHCDAHYDEEAQIYRLRTRRSAILALVYPADEK